MNIQNLFKRNLASDKLQIGLWLSLADAYTAEICAGADFDWLLVDGEHGPNHLRTILSQLQAIAPYRSTPVVRPPVGDPTIIKQYLDLGAQSLLVPMVDTPRQAAALVSAVRYPPAGVRGVGSAVGRASRWNRIPGYLRGAEKELCLIVQVESLEGLRNTRAIAETAGVDGVFLGPSDLSAALGHIGEPGHEEVLAAIDRALAEIAAAGKPSGILVGDLKLAHRFIEKGCKFVAVGTDVGVLVRGLDALIAEFRR